MLNRTVTLAKSLYSYFRVMHLYHLLVLVEGALKLAVEGGQLDEVAERDEVALLVGRRDVVEGLADGL